MDLIDEEGNLFGVVNVIDALVVLVLVAVFVTSVALVTGQGELFGSEQTVRHATLALGSQSAYVATAVDPGDTVARPGSLDLIVTDVFATPCDDGIYMMVRVRIPGQPMGAAVRYDGAPLRLDRELLLTTESV